MLADVEYWRLGAGTVPWEAPEGVHVWNAAPTEHVRMDVLSAGRPRHAAGPLALNIQ